MVLVGSSNVIANTAKQIQPNTSKNLKKKKKKKKKKPLILPQKNIFLTISPIILVSS